MKFYHIIIPVVVVIALIGVLICFTVARKAEAPNGQKDYNCTDFSTSDDARIFFEARGGSKENDPYGLDKNHDGQPCQNLPEAKKIAWMF